MIVDDAVRGGLIIVASWCVDCASVHHLVLLIPVVDLLPNLVFCLTVKSLHVTRTTGYGTHGNSRIARDEYFVVPVELRECFLEERAGKTEVFARVSINQIRIHVRGKPIIDLDLYWAAESVQVDLVEALLVEVFVVENSTNALRFLGDGGGARDHVAVADLTLVEVIVVDTVCAPQRPAIGLVLASQVGTEYLCV